MDNGCMAEISPEKRLAVWQHWYGDATDGFDACGVYIERDAKADTDNAWEVDHIFPAEILETIRVPEFFINHPANLQPLHHLNNESKGISYPYYTAKRVQPGTGTRQVVPPKSNKNLPACTMHGLPNSTTMQKSGNSLASSFRNPKGKPNTALSLRACGERYHLFPHRIRIVNTKLSSAQC